jgi:arylsulfatase A-like enzyme
MKRMAAEGFTADNLCANYPVCSPARAMLLTGRWPHETGVVDNATRDSSFLRSGEQTLGNLFSNAGYDTAYVGKWHLGSPQRAHDEFGFEHSIIWTKSNQHWNSRYIDVGGERRESNAYNATQMTDQLLEFIARPRSKPFFATVSWNPPHSDYVDAPEKFAALYPDEDAIPFRANHHEVEAKWRNVFAQRYRGYHAHISAIDAELGRLRAALDRLGLGTNTLLVYTSDHGGMMASHGHYGKRLPYAESLQVPFLASAPGRITPGSRSAAPLGLVDVPATLCALAGVAIPDEMRGRDFSPALRGETGFVRDSQFIMNVRNDHAPEIEMISEVPPLFRGVVTDRYTYALTSEGPWLLFDNREDPLQQRNFVADRSRAEVRDELHERVLHWIRSSGDRFAVASSPALRA